MGEKRIIHAPAGGRSYTVTSPITQGDYGYLLIPEGFDLPDSYRIDFATDRHKGDALTVYGDTNGAEVPQELIETGKDLYAFYVYIEEGFAKTDHTWKIPNKYKPRGGREATPTQQGAIDRLIIRAGEAVIKAEESAAFLHDASATATTLPAGSEATAELNDGQFYFGIPRGERGEPGPVGVTVNVSGTTPTIVAQADYRYVCGEVATLDFTPSASGICDVVFTSGATATVLTITGTVKWTNGFDPTSLDANTTYEINIMDGLGVACAWT